MKTTVFKSLKMRIATAVVLLFLAIFIVFLSTTLFKLIVVLSLALLGYYETDRIFFDTFSKARFIRMIIFIELTIIILNFYPTLIAAVFWAPLSFMSIRQIIALEKKAHIQNALHDISLELLAFIYSINLFGFLLPISNTKEGPQYLFLLFLIVFGGDTTAYFVGILWGKRRLAKVLSPKKSIEGALSAIIMSFFVTIGWYLIVYPHGLVHKDSALPSLIRFLSVAPFISVLAQFGDLFESLLKRSRSLKDSGQLLPGHGGLLDRIDGLALSSPAFYFLTIYFLQPK